MDATAISLCKDNQLPIIVYDLQARRATCGGSSPARSVGTMVKE